MFLAISLHYLTFLFREFGGEFTAQFYLNQVVGALELWSKYGTYHLAITLFIFYLLNFYSGYRFRRLREKISSIFLGIVLSTLSLPLLMYLAIEKTPFPRGVLILFFLMTLALNGLPRIFRPLIGRLNQYLENPANKNYHVGRVLVIGGGGYIGSVLCEHLLALGYRVRALDLMIFGDQSLEELEKHRYFELIRGDFRSIPDLAPCLDGVDAVVHLGGLVGDPACAVYEDLTVDINISATSMLMELCQTRGINRFIFASTCSVYGLSNDVLTEKSKLNPQSLYAKTKIDSENILLKGANKTFHPTILRFATVFGLSKRPRFDLVVNLFTAFAKKKDAIEVMGGNQWRPFVHVRDIARAIEKVLRAPISRVSGAVFNVGDDKMNFTIKEIAERVGQVVKCTHVKDNGTLSDSRNYKVSFEKIRSTLGFESEWTLEHGIEEIAAYLDAHPELDITDSNYNNYHSTKFMVASRDSAARTRLYKSDNLVEGYVKGHLVAR